MLVLIHSVFTYPFRGVSDRVKQILNAKIDESIIELLIEIVSHSQSM